MSSIVIAIAILIVLASLLASAEASISRMTMSRARALREQGHRNAALLEMIESEPARALNAVYLSVMFAQNGSAILVAILAEHYVGQLGVTIVSIAFTLAYFVLVEAMCKTFAILHSDSVALTLAPFVWFLGRALALPTRALIGLANILLPGKGLKQGPFATKAEIRSLAETGFEEGALGQYEKEMIHSVVQFGDHVVRDVMTPRPDIVAIDGESSLDTAASLLLERGLTRIPVVRGDVDHPEGIVHAKDILDALHHGNAKASLAELARPVRFVPESKRVAELLREMQRDKFHLAMVSDEYGLTSGLVTIENLIEQLVGNIRDEYDQEMADFKPLGDGRFRVNAALPITELNEALTADLPRDHWNTVGGLIFGVSGCIPKAGAQVELDGYRFTVEKIQGRRIETVLVERLPNTDPDTEG